MRRCLPILALAVAFAVAHPVAALDLSMPNATVTAQDTSPAGSVRLPDRPWTPDTMADLSEGAIRRQALRLPGSSRTTLQLLDPLRAALAEAGYREIFTCADAACGGFDFRFQLDILPEPEMHVDLGDYRYLLMRNDQAEPHTVSIVTSRSRTAGFAHITEVSRAYLPPVEATAVTEPAGSNDSLVDQLTATGHAVLGDLEFETGSAELGLGPFASLTTLADWLLGNPGARIILVGHTDAVGSLEGNTALSRRRAASVSDRLTGELGANPEQIQAAGAGYLSPRASNLTEEGRAANRRVEVVLLTLQ